MAINLLRNSGGVGDVRVLGGQARVVFGAFQFDDEYAAGGEAVDFTPYLGDAPGIVLLAPVSGYVFEYSPAAGKVKAMVGAVGGGKLVEVANDTDLTDLVIPFIAGRFM